jgi:2-polyprenyl-6-methoxyphenol hydroxylase-like FAD-dependent oxidoreductase
MKKPLSIAIVGAGIGGLAAAALLRRAGHAVRIYEQAAQFARVGAGIQMAPNAMKVLRLIGVEQHLIDVAFQAEMALSRAWDSGEPSSELPLGDTVAKQFGAPYLFLHRADLHAALLTVVPPDVIQLNRKLAGIEQTGGGVVLRFVDGTRETADAVIGADGVHSLVREIIVGPERPRFTGKVAYRTTFPASRVQGVTLAPVRTKWWGPDRHMVVYFVTRKRDELYFVTSVPEKAEWMTPESWSAKGDLDELQAAYKGFHPEVQAILQACPEVYKWALFERDPLPRWSDGHVALLGDACHPMTPYMAQGAASALEDAAILSRLLTGLEREGLPEAFRLYEAIRKPRASAIQAGSSANTWLKGKTDPAWVYGYDSTTVPLQEPAAA